MVRHGSHSVTCNYTNAYFYLVSIHQMSPTQTDVVDSNCSLLLINLPQKNERLSRPGWLTYSGQFTHISGRPSAAGWVQDRESSPVKNRRSTTVPRNQLKWCIYIRFWYPSRNTWLWPMNNYFMTVCFISTTLLCVCADIATHSVSDIVGWLIRWSCIVVKQPLNRVITGVISPAVLF